MTIQRAEALLTCEGECPSETLAAAKAAGLLAGRQAPSLIPAAQGGTPDRLTIEITQTGTAIRIVATAEAADHAAVLTAAAIAAVNLNLTAGAILQSLQPVDGQPDHPSADKPAVKASRARPHPSVTAPRRVQPTVLSGLMSPPVSHTTGPAEMRDAFRAFMTARHLRATEWAGSAQVPAAEIYAFLTGRARALPQETAEKLAQAAKVRVEDMFK